MDLFVSSVDITWRVLIVFSLAIFGIIARKCGFLREEARMSFADVMWNITLPPLVFVSMTADVNWGRLMTGMIAPAVALLLVILLSFGGMVLGRRLSLTADRLKTFQILCAMPNSAFIGFPVVLSIYGHQGLAYAVLYDVGTTVAFCSIAIMIMRGGGDWGENWKSLLSPALVAVICGLFINWLGIKIPPLILAPLRIMGDATVPLAMLLMGYTLGGLKLGFNSLTWELGLVCLLKLLLCPILAYLVLLPLPITPLVKTVIVLETAMPSMASTTVLVEKFKGDGEFAATGILATTVFSIFTIPLVAIFLAF